MGEKNGIGFRVVCLFLMLERLNGFGGELPAEFEGTDFVNQPFNDKNKMEESRFVDVKVCDYIVDLWESNKVINGYDVAKYEVIEKVKFLDRGMTSGIFRS